MGDTISIENETAYLSVSVAGTAPIESIDIRNGLDTIDTLRPYHTRDPGNRLKIVWSGAELRGRARMVSWDGSLQLKGNTIIDATAINFWNANHPLIFNHPNRLEWQSITTGGLSGILLKLEKANDGNLEIKTPQGHFEVAINSLGLEPKTWDYGGLKKKIEVYRLPEQQSPSEFSFQIPLKKLHNGVNPIYIRMAQEDCHIAWSSPIYLTDNTSNK
jgi:hypothetical protein